MLSKKGNIYILDCFRYIMDFKKIQVGELGNNGGNTEVLKQILKFAPVREDLNSLIENTDTKIKGDFFRK